MTGGGRLKLALAALAASAAVTALVATAVGLFDAGATSPSRLYGVTVDDTTNQDGIVSALQALPEQATVRVVADWQGALAPSTDDYRDFLNATQPVSTPMIDLRDSSYEKRISLTASHAMAADWVNTFGTTPIYEIGNEVNGNWLGSYSSVAQKLADSYRIASAAGARTALTLYLNDTNQPAGRWTAPGPDGPGELTPVAFTERYVPADVAQGLTYVFVSYYEADQGGVRPTATWLTSLFQELHSLYPNARLGFGEVGTPNPVSCQPGGTSTSPTTTTATTGTGACPAVTAAQGVLNYYYGLSIPLPYYVGGYFWWYWAEDGVAPGLLSGAFDPAFGLEASAP